jgi:hypothetical protein
MIGSSQGCSQEEAEERPSMGKKLLLLVSFVSITVVPGCGDSFVADCRDVTSYSVATAKGYCATHGTCCWCECLEQDKAFDTENPCTCSDIDERYVVRDVNGVKTCLIVPLQMGATEEDMELCLADWDSCSMNVVNQMEEYCN